MGEKSLRGHHTIFVSGNKATMTSQYGKVTPGAVEHGLHFTQTESVTCFAYYTYTKDPKP